MCVGGVGVGRVDTKCLLLIHTVVQRKKQNNLIDKTLQAIFYVKVCISS